MDDNGPNYLTGSDMQQHIEDCLLELLHNMSYHAISVTKLCKSARIARKTFYTYYPDKDACFYSLVHREILNSIIRIRDNLPINSDILTFYTLYLNYWKSERWFLEMILYNKLDHVFLQQTVRQMWSEDTSTLKLLNIPVSKVDMDILQSYASCEVSLLFRWCSRGFDTPVDEMAKKYIRLIHYPLIPLEKGNGLWMLSL